jgi:pyridoxal phosphate enzyme (YggS family)
VTIAEDLRAVKERIERAASAAKRDPKTVKLVAVSKTKPPEAIREAYAAGQRAFGENYAQELESKAAALADLTDIEWHFIGPLQTNKAKIIAKVAHVIHTVHKPDLAKELEKRLAASAPNDRKLDALVEVNVSGETQKHGAAPGDVASVLASIESCPHLRLRGLMTMPPADDDEAARRAFDGLRALRDANGGAARLPELSMGMSDDLEIAVASGATIVRVGTAIFGARS